MQPAEEQDALLACSAAFGGAVQADFLLAAVTSVLRSSETHCHLASGCCTASCARIYSGGDFVLLTEGVPLQGNDCWTAQLLVRQASSITVFDFFLQLLSSDLSLPPV